MRRNPCLAVKKLIQPNFTAFKRKQYMAHMADLPKQMWFLLTFEMYKL